MFLKLKARWRIGIERALCGSSFDLRCVQNIAIDLLIVLVRVLALVVVQQEILQTKAGIRQMMKPEKFALEDAAQNVDEIVLSGTDVVVCLFFSLRHGDVFSVLRGSCHNQQRQQQGLAKGHHCLLLS